MANDFHSRAIKLAKYEDLRPAAYGVLIYRNFMVNFTVSSTAQAKR